MPDRLQELLHQRATIQAHLAWLDREIAQLRPSAPAEPVATSLPLDKTSVPSAANSPVPAPLAPPAIPSTEVDPDAILTRFQHDASSLRTDVRKGCFLYFFGAFALLGVAVALFYFINTRFLRPASEPAPVEQNAPSPGR